MRLVIMFSLVTMLFGFQACENGTYVTYTANVPVYMSYDILRSSVKVTENVELEKPGKIYFKDDFIYINEYRKGIHVIDNSDPSNPFSAGFIEIPGNVDMAIRNNTLFADSYIDLVIIDISDINNIVEIDRENGVFEYFIPEYDPDYELAEVDRKKGVVVDWKIDETRQKVNTNYYPIYRNWAYEDVMYGNASSVGGGMPTGGSDFGVGGSMARFGQYSDYLFVLSSNWMLKTFEVENNGKVDLKDSTYISWNIETMYILHETMFIGSQSGMFIYDLSNLPAVNFISQFNHFRACDPVVADDKYAYVTLKVGGRCGRGQNVLEVIDISDLEKPELKKTWQMSGPQGLGKDDDVLFICDGEAGLKVYDASKPVQELPLISSFPDVHAIDVIPVNGNLFMIGEDGFYQYDYSDLQNITLLSHIEVILSE